MGTMKKYFIHYILTMVLLMVFYGSNSYSQGSEIEGYYPFKVNAGYYYLQPARGQYAEIREYIECIKRSISDGELTGTFKTTTYVGSGKLTRISIYAIANNQVLLNFQEKTEYMMRPIIFKLPKPGQTLKWINYFDETDHRTSHHTTAEYVTSVKTNFREFKDVILVSEDIYDKNKYYYTYKWYYAKGYGLVKRVSSTKGKKSDKPDVMELVKIEDEEKARKDAAITKTQPLQTKRKETEEMPPNVEDKKIVTVTWTSVTILSGPGKNYSEVTTVKKGDKLIIVGESGEWLNVRLENGAEGWIRNNFVK